jgi:hypothetical protein
VSAVPGTRTLDSHGNAQALTGFTKSTDIIHPGFLIEIRGKETTGVVRKHGINADDVTSLEMVYDDLIGYRKELAI